MCENKRGTSPAAGGETPLLILGDTEESVLPLRRNDIFVPTCHLSCPPSISLCLQLRDSCLWGSTKRASLWKNSSLLSPSLANPLRHQGLTSQSEHSSHLTAVSLSPQDVNIEDLYKGGEQTTRFTFFQRSLGSAFRLEAAACPGWFLSSPAKPQQPVQLTKESEPSTHTEFYFEQSQ